jgi:hypothetical protein
MEGGRGNEELKIPIGGRWIIWLDIPPDQGLAGGIGVRRTGGGFDPLSKKTACTWQLMLSMPVTMMRAWATIPL